MPTLKYFASQVASGAPRLYCVHKPVTTVGKALGNDVAIAGSGVAAHHVQILFDGRDFVLEELDRDADIAINGKKKRRARLVHGDRLQLGAVELAFSMFAEGAMPAAESEPEVRPASVKAFSAELAGVRKLFAFSE